MARAGVAHTYRSRSTRARYVVASFVRSVEQYASFLRAVAEPVRGETEPAEDERVVATLAAANRIIASLGPGRAAGVRARRLIPRPRHVPAEGPPTLNRMRNAVLAVLIVGAVLVAMLAISMAQNGLAASRGRSRSASAAARSRAPRTAPSAAEVMRTVEVVVKNVEAMGG